MCADVCVHMCVRASVFSVHSSVMCCTCVCVRVCVRVCVAALLSDRRQRRDSDMLTMRPCQVQHAADRPTTTAPKNRRPVSVSDMH